MPPICSAPAWPGRCTTITPSRQSTNNPDFPTSRTCPMQKPLNIGMIGYGFMGRAHSNAYRKVWNFFDLQHRPVLKAACARDAAKVKAFADKWGYESIETDWRKLLDRKDIDVVDI